MRFIIIIMCAYVWSVISGAWEFEMQSHYICLICIYMYMLIYYYYYLFIYYFCITRFVLTAATEVKEHMKTNQEEAQQKIKQLEVPD